ncbi:Creatinase [Thalassovita gelatinovora]|uniref:Creatinase n=1 Tax=Thalassovita gelatinovora TaxID=53501 RepID=A0A0P1F6F1_THAGE|nr:M24 family metallopeptidase [Thalassovita gelatinovora]QIZ80974.1 M24 family metallopeptidase [Thalassovita gelatinovora]CUH63510.1 Creatinase [Thalassovita gelatinovora]SEQ68386.1 ectoine hydrolase [Thalassovita gelatinovora]
MTQKAISFSPAEYRRRLMLTRAAMAERDLDAIFIEDPSNMAWLTGYDGWSFYVHQGLIVTHNTDPVWWGRNMDANGARRTAWIGEDVIRPYGDEYVQSTSRHPMQHLAALLKEMGFETARIGVEMENYYFSAKAYTTLLAELPQAEIVDATALVNWQRAVKSDEELTFMHRAARIAEKMVLGAIDRSDVGVKKNELVADIYHDALTGADGHWGDYPAIVPMCPSGADASAAHLTWNGAELRSGECTFFELAGVYRRYHTPLSRTVFLGTPPEDMKRAEAALVEGLEAGIDAARAGNVAGDIARALAGPLDRAGIERGARCGYSIGLSYPPDWGERTISLRDEDETELLPGMTFHFMPGLWTPEWGLEITEPVLITDRGPAKPFCNLPRQLFVKADRNSIMAPLDHSDPILAASLAAQELSKENPI